MSSKLAKVSVNIKQTSYFAKLLCVIYGTPCHRIGHEVLPTQPLPREAEVFPRGGKYPKDLSLSILLAYLQPV